LSILTLMAIFVDK